MGELERRILREIHVYRKVPSDELSEEWQKIIAETRRRIREAFAATPPLDRSM